MSSQWEPEQVELINAAAEMGAGEWRFRVQSPPTEVIGKYPIAVGETTAQHHLAHFVSCLSFPAEWVTMNGLSPWLSQFWGNVRN